MSWVWEKHGGAQQNPRFPTSAPGRTTAGLGGGPQQGLGEEREAGMPSFGCHWAPVQL